jgi:hypothetical protein
MQSISHFFYQVNVYFSNLTGLHAGEGRARREAFQLLGIQEVGFSGCRIKSGMAENFGLVKIIAE